jgi:hypothetical protein
MGIYIRDFKATDLLEIDCIEPLKFEEIYPEWAVVAEESKLAVTGIRNGKVVGCGGVHPSEQEGQGWLWMRIDKDCLHYPVETMRWLKSGIKILEEMFPFRQLNAVVKCGYERGVRFIEQFGYNLVQIKKGQMIYSKLVRQ